MKKTLRVRKKVNPLLILINLALLLFVIGCSSINKIAQTSNLSDPGDALRNTTANKSNVIGGPKTASMPITQPKTEEEIPPGSIMVFYSTKLSSIANRLPVSVQYTDSEGGGYATNIRWESTGLGVVRYIPVVDRFDVMGTTTSYSYSKSSIFPLTINGRVFYIVERGASSTLNEVDPKTAKVKYSTPITETTFAIVDNNIYFYEEVRTDFYGKMTGGGELMVQAMRSTQPILLQPYRKDRGTLYGVAGALLSVYYDYDTKTNSIRKHDTKTGEITEVLFSGIPTGGEFISGDDALYELVKKSGYYQLNRYPPEGDAKVLLEIELDPGEEGISADVGQGKVMIASYDNNYKVKSILLYDIAGDFLEEVPVKTPFSPNNNEFIILE